MFIRPCDGAITSRFQKGRLDPVGGKIRRDHVGTDFAKTGTVPIRAVANGKVILARSTETDGFGRVVFIEHNLKEGEFVTVYAHLSSVAVRAGQVVSQGTSVGAMGNTGNSTGQHLHFELHLNQRFSDNRNAVDTMMYLPLEVALKNGDKGPNVKNMQDLLVKKGHLIKADGVFGPATEKAVKAYQIQNKLVADGVAGVATIAVLGATNTPKKEDTKLAKYRLMTGTFATKADAEKAAIRLKKEFGWVVYVKEA
ncbi:peptidoglycan DD-metalloendopeptidase family protein [Sporosarcina sp. FA9]|uniref:peptidoglycan DD-metalloendopeptidase family protein n=1 Tax=Sporosarcina sp. FA9 TaxID=3413030 RepID=UPI003F65A641